MEKFVVTCKSEIEHKTFCDMLTGYELAEMYAFAENDEEIILRIWEPTDDGDLIPCRFWGDYYGCKTVLYVHRFGNYEPYEYEYPERY